MTDFEDEKIHCEFAYLLYMMMARERRENEALKVAASQLSTDRINMIIKILKSVKSERKRDKKKKALSITELIDQPLRAPMEHDPACNGDSKHDPTVTKEQLDREMDVYRRSVD